MRLVKTIRIIFGVILFTRLGLFDSVPFAVAQEMSIEELYLNDTVGIMIIREYIRSDDREEKLVALEYLRQLIDDKESPQEVQALLAYMALEGVLNKVRSDGRIANNFPDIRIKAVEYLGDMELKEASDTLLRVLEVENEPLVVSAAVRSLSKLGYNDNDYTLNMILHVFSKYDAVRPNNILALSVIDSCTVFMQTGEKKNPWIYATLMHISTNQSYVRPVRDYANKTLTRIYQKGEN
ncbi:MAG: HEAT repeat domain-containing protein [Spirochaetaceae bacterium]|jgi:HEAT repeat protein|nr:HEAT repeat domain-containing protein [Spirochaetaceae bacterium]